MSFIGTREAANKWRISQNTVQNLCRLGMIPGAIQEKKGACWYIPGNAQITLKFKRIR